MLNMGEQVRNSGTPGIKVGRTYVGKVVDNKDPLFLQRVKVRVDLIMDDWADEHLPWAIPEGLDHDDGCSADTGTVNVPIIGSKVSVEFLDGQPTHPAYSGYHEDSTTVMTEAKYNYPNRKVRRFKDGTLVVLDKTDNVLYVYTPTTVKVKIEGDVELYVKGNVTEQVDGNVIRYVKGNVDEYIEGNYTRHVAGNVNDGIGGYRTEEVAGSVSRKSASVLEVADGSAAYKGSSMTVYGTGSAGVGSGGVLALQGSTIHENGGPGVSAPGSAGSATEAAKAVFASWPGMRAGV